MDKQKIEMRQEMDVNGAIAYLESFIAELKAGRLVLAQDGESLTLVPAEVIELEIEAKRKKDKEKFSLEISWSRHLTGAAASPCAASAGAGDAPCAAAGESAPQAEDAPAAKAEAGDEDTPPSKEGAAGRHPKQKRR
jgi:amphi-Trp domain-containing protein